MNSQYNGNNTSDSKDKDESNLNINANNTNMNMNAYGTVIYNKHATLSFFIFNLIFTLLYFVDPPRPPMPFGYPPMAGNFIPAGGMMPIRPVVPMPFAVVPPIAPAAVPMNPDTTGYFGNLSPNISEDVVTAILTCCGGFKRLKGRWPFDRQTEAFALVELKV